LGQVSCRGVFVVLTLCCGHWIVLVLIFLTMGRLVGVSKVNLQATCVAVLLALGQCCPNALFVADVTGWEDGPGWVMSQLASVPALSVPPGNCPSKQGRWCAPCKEKKY
jgi:hypothetical protein